MVSSSKRGVRRNLFPGRISSSMSPWYSAGRTHTTLYSMLAAFIGGQLLLTGVFLMRSSPPCDCRCQWRPEQLEVNRGKAARSVADLPIDIPRQMFEGMKLTTSDYQEKYYSTCVYKKDENQPGNDNGANVVIMGAKKITPNPRNIIRTKVTDDVAEDHSEKPLDSIGDMSNTSDNVAERVTNTKSFGIPEPFTILTTTNTAFSDLTENWLESLRRLGRPYNVTLIAEDLGAFQYLKDRRTMLESSGLRINLRFTDKNASNSTALGFYTKEYIQLVGKRPHYILDILRSGVGVLFADADAVWLKDPISHIADSYSRYDVWVALGEGGKIPCPCFMYMKPTPRAMAMVSTWQSRIEDQLNTTSPENDQSALDWVMHNHIRYKRLRVKKLDLTAFPTGQSMFLKKGWYSAHKSDIYVVHANKIGGYAKKKFVLRWKKLWYIGKDKNTNGTHL